MARQQKSLQKLAAYRAGTLGALDRHSQTGSMRSHGRSGGGLGASMSGHSTLLVTSVADADEDEQLHEWHDPTHTHAHAHAHAHEPLPAVAVTTTTSSSSSRAATPPETSAGPLPDVDDEGVLRERDSDSLADAIRVARNLSFRVEITSIT